MYYIHHHRGSTQLWRIQPLTNQQTITRCVHQDNSLIWKVYCAMHCAYYSKTKQISIFSHRPKKIFGEGYCYRLCCPCVFVSVCLWINTSCASWISETVCQNRLKFYIRIEHNLNLCIAKKIFNFLVHKKF